MQLLAFLEKGDAKDDEVMNIKWELARLLLEKVATIRATLKA